MFEVLADKLALWITLYGGRGSGKSRTAVLIVVVVMLIQKRFVAVARDYKDDVKNSIWRNVVERISELGLGGLFKITKEEINCLVTGSQVVQYGLLENPDKIKSLESCDLLVMEESAHTPKYVWETVIPTIRSDGAAIITIFNPDWERDETFRRQVTNQEELENGYFVRLINYLDNPWCPEIIIKNAEAMKRNDPELYKNIYLGVPKSTSQREVFMGVYSIEPFSPDEIETYRNSPDYKGEATFHKGVEWGYSQKPTAVVTCYEYDGCLYVWREAGGVGLELDDIAKCIESMSCDKGRKFRVSPALPATKKLVRKQLKKASMITTEKWSDEDLDRIKFLRGAYRKIIIHPECKQVIHDFRHYWWEMDEKQGIVKSKPIDENNQYIKAICHALYRRINAI